MSTAVERCACGKYALERWCGTYADMEGSHRRDGCVADGVVAPQCSGIPSTCPHCLRVRGDNAEARILELTAALAASDKALVALDNEGDAQAWRPDSHVCAAIEAARERQGTTQPVAADPNKGRCDGVGPAPQHFRCGLPEGHGGEHTALIPSDAPWLGQGTTQQGGGA